MRKRQFDITGKKFGELYVVKRDHLSNKGWYWFCNCSCNKTTIVRIDHLTGGRIKSCGCKLKGKTSVHWKGYEKISGAEWGSIKEGAIDRHLLLEISIKDIWNQFEKQNGKCALTNLDIDFNRGKHSKNVYLGSASLDRINNNKGYTIDNIWWVHKDINYMKSTFKLQDFLKYIYKIASPIIHTNISTSCTINKKYGNWKGFGNISRKYINRIKLGAQKRNLSYRLSDKFLWNLFLQQGGYCALTGISIGFAYWKEIKQQTASLDRIDSHEPYIESNIQWVHKDINAIKSNFVQSYLIKMCKLAYNNREKYNGRT